MIGDKYYVEFEDTKVTRSELKDKMLEYLDSTNEYSKGMDDLVLYCIEQTVNHFPIDVKRVTRIMERFAENVCEEILMEKFHK